VSTNWNDVVTTLVVTWPPIVAGLVAHDRRIKTEVTKVTQQAAAGQTGEIQQIVKSAADSQTQDLLSYWPAKVVHMNYVIAPERSHMDHWLAEHKGIDPTGVRFVAGPADLDGLDGAVVVVLNAGSLTGPAAELASKAWELAQAGRITIRTDAT
jgi:hypothetical protein